MSVIRNASQKPKAKRARGSTPRRGIKRGALGLMMLLLLAGIMVFIAPALPLISRYAALPVAPQKPVTLVVAGVSHYYVGYHTRGTLEDDFNRGLTDTMIVVQLNPGQNALKLLTLPRDTKVGSGFTANDKINAALPRGGPGGMVQTVSDLLGIPVDGYVLVSLDGTRELVDALGGIELYVPRAMQYSDAAAKLEINLKPGLQKLSGAEIEGYLRFRHDNLGDIGRQQRQQAFYRALLERLRQPRTFFSLPAIAGVIERNTRTNLDRSHASAALGLLLRRPRTDTLLLPGNFGNPYGVSYWLPNAAEIQTLVTQHLRTNQSKARDARGLAVAVVNTTQIAGLARKGRERLRNKGFRDVRISSSNTGNPSKTIIQCQNYEEGLAVREALGVGEVLVSGEGVLDVDLTVRFGEDFQQP